MIFRNFLIVAVSQNFFVPCEAINGVIWNKSRQSFVRIFSIPSFAAKQREFFDESRRLETHNFNREILRAAYYEEKNIVEFYDNDTKVRGICGEVWNLLADYSNFTFVPMKPEHRSFGVQLPNGSHDGLLGLIERGETQAILRTGFYLDRLNMITYAMPLWKSSYRLYIQPKWKHDSRWVITLFSREAWYTTIGFFLSLCLVGYLLDKLHKREWKDTKHEDFGLSDHAFQTFALMCSQGDVSSGYYKKWKILSFSKSMFAWMIVTAFSSNLIYKMAYRSAIPPFQDLPSMVNDTNYTVLAFEGSMVYESFKEVVYRLGDRETINQRVKFLQSREEMFNRACRQKTVAVFQNEDKHMAYSRIACKLVPVGRSYFPTWISAALAKNYKYKKAVDIGILKLTEVGLMDVLKDRFLNSKLVSGNSNPFSKVHLTQVSLIFLMLSGGIVLSILVLIIENIVYISNTNPQKIVYLRNNK